MECCSVAVQRYLCQVLGDLSVDEASIQIMLDKKTCKYLLLLMTKARADAEVQVAACRAVANMCMHNPAARTFFAEFLPVRTNPLCFSETLL
jgi:RNA-binding protein YlmH